MTESEVKALAALSFRNRDRIASARQRGCYYCRATFAPQEIKEWVDDAQTALCPRCGIDAVLAGVTDSAVLQSLNDRQFGKAVSLTPEQWRDWVNEHADR